MLKVALLLLAVVAASYCYPAPYWAGYPYLGFPFNYYTGVLRTPYVHHVAPFLGARLVFYGEFPGDCEDKPDGLYYVDERSFAYCFSGRKTIQPCAEGSANPPLEFFNQGGYYGLADFCSINLLDHANLANSAD